MCSSDMAAADAAASSTSTTPPWRAPLAAVAASRQTVRMVPSTGRMTAASASRLAPSKASATPEAPTAPAAPRPSARPLRIWERITPELPRAPMSDPWMTALCTAELSASSRPATTDSRVRAMLVPVSPSGTG